MKFNIGEEEEEVGGRQRHLFSMKFNIGEGEEKEGGCMHWCIH